MTREQAFKEINETQDYYINELKNKIEDPKSSSFMEINFTSATGTGKTKMMSKLMNLMSNYFFIITTLSKGQLKKQIEKSLKKDSKFDNFIVYGNCDYKINSKLQSEDIIASLPIGKKIIWLRDEGHINTNRFTDLLINNCYKIINFSATNQYSDIKCNFTHTMMLRTVHQTCGTPEDAILKLLEVKKQHEKVKKYNPCAIFRIVDKKTFEDDIIKLCQTYNLKYINITDENYEMEELCEDDNEYDVIINKFKITEGVDIRRAHVIYMDNQPSNNDTTIQVIGRSRRNALLYREDIDIFEKNNKKLLEETRQCYVFYNVKSMKISEDENGELENEFCDIISVEKLKENTTIEVINGKMANGLTIAELKGETGQFKILFDENLKCKVVNPEGEFYKKETIFNDNIIAVESTRYHGKFLKTQKYYKFYKMSDIERLPIHNTNSSWNWFFGKYMESDCSPYVCLDEEKSSKRQIKINKKEIKKEINSVFKEKMYNTLKIVKMKKMFKRINFKRNLLKEIDFSEILTYYRTMIPYNHLKNNDFEKILELYFFEEERHRQETNFDDNKILTEKEIEDFMNEINFKIDNIKNNIIEIQDTERIITPCDYSGTVSKDRIFKSYKIELSSLNKIGKYLPFYQIVNDRESAIIGVDKMKGIKSNSSSNEITWIEDRAITSKVKTFNKLNSFIETKYSLEIENFKKISFTGKNKFNFDKKCNACLGYCVEYYSKYLVYGQNYLYPFLDEVCKEAKWTSKEEIPNTLIIRACMLKYKELMKRAYGSGIDKIIKTISIEQLIKETYLEFVKIVVKLGSQASVFVKKYLYNGKDGMDNIDPNLSIKHITGLADYITQDTIVDIKVQNHIDIYNIKQVLAYHYLSTKRSDLNIKKLYVYDASSNKVIFINLETHNVSIIENF